MSGFDFYATEVRVPPGIEASYDDGPDGGAMDACLAAIGSEQLWRSPARRKWVRRTAVSLDLPGRRPALVVETTGRFRVVSVMTGEAGSPGTALTVAYDPVRDAWQWESSPAWPLAPTQDRTTLVAGPDDTPGWMAWAQEEGHLALSWTQAVGDKRLAWDIPVHSGRIERVDAVSLAPDLVDRPTFLFRVERSGGPTAWYVAEPAGQPAAAPPLLVNALDALGDGSSFALDSAGNAWAVVAVEAAAGGGPAAELQVQYASASWHGRAVALPDGQIRAFPPVVDEDAPEVWALDKAWRAQIVAGFSGTLAAVVPPVTEMEGQDLQLLVVDPGLQDPCLGTGALRAARGLDDARIYGTPGGFADFDGSIATPVPYGGLPDVSLVGMSLDGPIVAPAEAEPRVAKVAAIAPVPSPEASPTGFCAVLICVFADGVRWSHPDGVALMDARSLALLSESHLSWFELRPVSVTPVDPSGRMGKIRDFWLIGWELVVLAILLTFGLPALSVTRLYFWGARKSVAEDICLPAVAARGRGFAIGDRSPAFLFGRLAEVNEVAERLLAAPRRIVVGGPARTGKTWFVRAVHQVLLYLAGSRAIGRDLPFDQSLLVIRWYNFGTVMWRRIFGPPGRAVLPVWVAGWASRVPDETESWTALDDAVREIIDLYGREATLNMKVARILADIPVSGPPGAIARAAALACEAADVRLVLTMKEGGPWLEKEGSGPRVVLAVMAKLTQLSVLVDGPRAEQAARNLDLASGTFQVRTMPPLPMADAALLLRTLAHLSPLRPDARAAREIARACAGEPYVMQMLGALLFEPGSEDELEVPADPHLQRALAKWREEHPPTWPGREVRWSELEVVVKATVRALRRSLASPSGGRWREEDFTSRNWPEWTKEEG